MFAKRLLRIGDIIETKRGYIGRISKKTSDGIILDSKEKIKMNYIRKLHTLRDGADYINDYNLMQIYSVGSKY